MQHGSIYVLLRRAYLCLACLSAFKVMAEFSGTDSQHLTSINYTLGVRNSEEGVGSYLREIFQILQGPNWRRPGYEWFTGISPFTTSFDYLSYGMSDEIRTDVDIVGSLAALGYSLGAFDKQEGLYDYYYFNKNKPTLYECLMGWDASYSGYSNVLYRDNGLLAKTDKIVDRMDVVTNKLQLLTEVFTNSIGAIVQNQTNISYQLSPIFSSDMGGADTSTVEDYSSLLNNSGMAYWFQQQYGSLYSLPYYFLVPGDLEQSQNAYTAYMSDIFLYNEASEEVASVFKSLYGNLRSPESMNPSTADERRTWSSEADADVAAATSTNEFVQSYDWSTNDVSPQIMPITVEMRDTVSDFLMTDLPKDSVWQKLSDTFQNATSSRGYYNGRLSYAFSASFGDKTVAIEDFDFASKAPSGFFSNIKVHLNEIFLQAHYLLHMILLVSLYLHMQKIVLSAFGGGSDT